MARDISYDCRGPGNQAILGDVASQYPPTLNDIPPQQAPKLVRYADHLFSLLDTIFRPPMSYGASSWLRNVRFSEQLDDQLPVVTDSGSHVYLVTKPTEDFPLSWTHWSLYTQGRFYHLSANVAGDTLGQSDASGPRRAIRTSLKVEDYSSPESRLNSNRDGSALIAYEVGRTHFPHELVHTLAEWTIEHFYGDYDLLKANCQMFVRALLYRIVMTSLDHSVFAGSKGQLAEWDLVGRASNPERFANTREEGFVLIKPCNDPRALIFQPPFNYLLRFRLGRAKRIVVLYSRGAYAIGAWDPTGTHGQLGYAWTRFRADMHQSLHEGNRCFPEFFAEIRARNWRQALKGRKETNLMLYAKHKERSSGGRIGRLHLRLDRWLLSIDEEDERAIELQESQ